MPRPPRLEIAGALYHLMSRGNSRKRVFFDDDCLRFLRQLRDNLTAYDVVLYGYVLMSKGSDSKYSLLIFTGRRNRRIRAACRDPLDRNLRTRSAVGCHGETPGEYRGHEPILAFLEGTARFPETGPSRRDYPNSHNQFVSPECSAAWLLAAIRSAGAERAVTKHSLKPLLAMGVRHSGRRSLRAVGDGAEPRHQART